MIIGSIGTRLALIGGCLGLLAASHWYAYGSGNTNGANAVLVASQKETIKALHDRVKENAADVVRYQSEARKANEDYAQEIADIRTAAHRIAGKRVPIDPRAFCPGAAAGAAQAATAGGNGQEDTGTAVLPESFAADLRQLATEAAEVTADLRTLKGRAAGCFE